MASKVGNAQWATKVPQAANNKTIIIGMDMAADKVQNGTVVVFCATMANYFSQFYSSTYLQKTVMTRVQRREWSLQTRQKAFYQHNKYFPLQIIILRNVCANSQISVSLDHEVRDFNEGIQKAIVRGSSPTLTYIIVGKKARHKVFKKVSGKLVNAAWGALINSGIVSNNYNFCILSQGGGIATVKPGYYKVIYSDSKSRKDLAIITLHSMLQLHELERFNKSSRVLAVYQKTFGFIDLSVNSSKNSEHVNKKLYFI